MRPAHLFVPAVAALVALPGVPASAGSHDRGAAPVEVALIADTPYGDAQRRQFPALVEAINADPQVRMVLHGDRDAVLVHGDEHRYGQEPAYGGVPNLTRLETYGDTAVDRLRLTIDPRDAAVFSWVSRTVEP